MEESAVCLYSYVNHANNPTLSIKSFYDRLVVLPAFPFSLIYNLPDSSHESLVPP